MKNTRSVNSNIYLFECSSLNSRKGFTLLELLIVLFLATLILSLAAVFFANTLSSGRLNASARELSASIRHAKSLAQLKSERQTLTIDLDSKHYGIGGHGVNSIPRDIEVLVMDPFSGEIRNGKYNITFQPYGGVEGGTVILRSRKRTVSIQVDPVVGSIMIK